MRSLTATAALAIAVLPFAQFANAQGYQAIPGAELVERAQAMLIGIPGESAERLTVEYVGPMTPSQVPSGSYEIEVGQVHGKWPRRRVGVPVSVLQDERVVLTRMMWFNVSAWSEGLVYSRSATQGDMVAAESTTIGNVDAVASNAAMARGVDVLAGKRLRRSVRAGQPVLLGDLEPVPLVVRDGAVRVLVTRGAVTLAIPGKAGRDGAMNELVDVLASGAESSVKARVIARNEVQVEH